MSDKNSVTRIIARIAEKSGESEENVGKLLAQTRVNNAAGNSWAQFKTWAMDLLKQALKSIKTYIILAISAYLAHINDLFTNLVD